MVLANASIDRPQRSSASTQNAIASSPTAAAPVPKPSQKEPLQEPLLVPR